MELKTGEIIYQSGSTGDNSLYKGVRPVVCLRNFGDGTILVVPLTSKNKKQLPTHLAIFKKDYQFLAKDSLIMTEQIDRIPLTQVNRKMGRLTQETFNAIIEKVKISIGLFGKGEGRLQQGCKVFLKDNSEAIVLTNNLGCRYSPIIITLKQDYSCFEDMDIQTVPKEDIKAILGRVNLFTYNKIVENIVNGLKIGGEEVVR